MGKGPQGTGTAAPASPVAHTTAAPPVPVAEAMIDTDWHRSSVGPPAQWPAALQMMSQVVLSSRFSMWMGWGPELAFFYNDAYARDTLATKHPWALGRPASEVWEEIWADIEPRIDLVMAGGEATWDQNLRLFLKRSGYLEETYHTFSYSPLFDAASIVGMLCVVSETTLEVIGERRMSTLRDLAAGLSGCTDESDVAAAVERALAANPFDLPFSMTYLLDDQHDARLVAATGVAPGATISPLRLASDSSGIWTCPTVTTVIDDLDARTTHLPCGAWDRAPEAAVIVPILPSGSEQPMGFLVVGQNPHRTLDLDYVGFVELVAGQIAAAVNSARSFEAERRRSEALAALDQAKTAFFTNISHEFRTPLTLLLAPIEDALTTVLEEGNRSRLELAHRNALRLLRLVNALLDFSRLEAGGLVATPVVCDLARETSEVAGMFRSAIEAGGVDLVVDCAPAARPVVADRHLWELIVTNLLSNAFKHTFAGTITVRLADEGDRVRLEVTDTGIGIPPDQLPLVFSRFHRVAGSASRSHEGSGVGLSLVRELVELQGGTIALASTVGAGTTFSVTMPIGTPATAADTPDTGEQPGHASATRSRNLAAHLAEVQQWVQLDGRETPLRALQDEGSVLVVDDNADMREYLRRLLSSRFRVRTATDGADALRLIEDEAPDLVVADVMMPTIDGLELVRRLRAQGRHVDTPVILLSARAGPEASIEGLEVGADDYLVKPFSGEELVGRVAARLGSRHERRRAQAIRSLANQLADTDDHQRLTDAVLGTASELLGVNRIVLGIRERGLLRNLFAPELHGGLGERWHAIDLEAAAPIAVAARTGDTVVVHGVDDVAQRYPDVSADHRAAGSEAGVFVPLCDRVGDPIGALAFTWPHEHDVGEEAVRSCGEIATVIARAVERIEVRRREARVGAEIQAQLLTLDPRTRLGVVAARYRPADTSLVVGGDWYDAIAIDDHRHGFAVGDVVGHGLPGAVVMGQLRSALAAVAATGADPAEVVEKVDAFADRIPDAQCTTLAYCTIEQFAEGAAAVRWHAGGHPPPIVTDEHETTVLWGGRGLPLGVGCRTRRIGVRTLRAGSLVVLYTDGLVERRGIGLDERIEQLRALVHRYRHLPVGACLDGVVAEMTDRYKNTDDLAIIGIRLAGATPQRFVDVFPSSLENLRGSRSRLRSWLAQHAPSATDGDDALLAIGEAVANAIEHGNRMDAARTVAVEVCVRPEGLTATVTDSGRWDRDSSRSVRDDRGRGLRIMEHVARDVTVERSRVGTTVTLELHAPRTVHAPH